MEDYFDDFDGDLTAAGLPLPLTPKASPSIDFPIEALGPLQEVANSLSEQLQVPIGSVVNSILSLTSLATQDYATVATPLGIECPLCLYFITVTGHAARNALVDNYVFYELKNFERELREKLVRQEEEKNSREDSSNSPDINAIAMQSMHCLSGLSFDTLMKLSPSLPKSTLYESVDVNQFTANARGVLNQAQAQRIGNINKFWKGEDIILMYGHRFEILSRQKLTLKLEVTESTAIERLRADRAGASDLLSKSLVVWPDIRSGNRRQYEIRREDIKGLRTFNDKILNLMSKRSESGNSLQQKTLYLETGALNILLEILETIEDRSKSGNSYELINCLTENAAEIICRISGVLTIYEDESATSINLDAMACGCGLFIYFAEELSRLQSVCAVEEKISDAEKLLVWLRDRSNKQIEDNQPRYVLLRHLLQYGPPRMRVKKQAEQALTILEDHKWIYREESGKKIYVKFGPIPARR